MKSAKLTGSIGVLWLMMGAVSLPIACQQPEDDLAPTDGGNTFDSLVVTVPDSGEPLDVSIGNDGPGNGETGVADSGGSSDAGQETPADSQNLPEVATDLPGNGSQDAPSEIQPPEATPVGPCPAGSPPLAPTGWTATVSVLSPGDFPGKAFDGRLNTRWSTGRNVVVGQWFRLDMASVRSIERFQLDAGEGVTATDFPHGYAVTLSTDDITYHQVAAGEGTAQLTTVSFPLERARYMKITTTSTSIHWWGIAEMIVCGR